MTSQSDELRQAAELLEFWFNMEADNETARDEEDRDPEYTKVIKAALIVSKCMRKHLAATKPDDRNSLCAWCSEPKGAHAESGLCRGTTSQYFTRKCQPEPDEVSAQAKLDFLKSKGITVGLAKEAGKEPYLTYVIEEGSELCDHETIGKLIDANCECDRWRSIAIALYERAVWFFHRKSEEFKSKPELDKITQANGCEGWISTLAANWHNDFASDLSQIMPPEIGMPVPDEGGPIDEEGHWSTGLFTVEVFRYSSRYAVMLSDCDNEVVEDLHHIKTKAQLRKLLEALGAK